MVHGISGELNMAAAPSGPGARGEAEAGFPTVMAALRQLGTSDFQSLENLSFGLVQEPCSGLEPGILDYDLIKVLVSVSARMEDSNIIRRSGKEVLNTYRLLSEELDRRAGWIDKVWREEYYRLCVFTLKNRISPGGAADMVSAALFLRFLEKNEQMRAEDSREYSVLPIVKTEI
jgi:triphosphoribosyl-dephospho-CoA synthetase